MNQQVAEGMTVYDAAGEKIGKVRAYEAESGYIEVEKGWLFPKDFYIPLGAIASSDGNNVQLSLTRDALSDARYESIPTADAAAGGVTWTDDHATTSTGYAVTDNTAERSTDTNDLRVPVMEEELVVGTRREQTGAVHLRKEVMEQQETVPVTLRHEEVTVERVPMDASVEATTLDNAFQTTDIDMRVMGEEAVVAKQARTVEEVRLHKDVVTDQQQVSDTVRKERVTVDEIDERDAGATTTGYTRMSDTSSQL